MHNQREPARVIRGDVAAREREREIEVLDGVSDHLGELLRRADELLLDWSRFGTAVRAQVEREASEVGAAVARAVDGAVARAASTSVERGLAEQLGARLAALSSEIVKLEARAKAASRAVAEDRRTDRRVLWLVAAGVVAANVLLAGLLLRGPETPTVVPPAIVPERVEDPAALPSPAVAPDLVDAGAEATEPAAPIDATLAEPPPATAKPAPAKKPGPTVKPRPIAGPPRT